MHEQRRAYVDHGVGGGGGLCDLTDGLFDLFVGYEILIKERIAKRSFAG